MKYKTRSWTALELVFLLRPLRTSIYIYLSLLFGNNPVLRSGNQHSRNPSHSIFQIYFLFSGFLLANLPSLLKNCCFVISICLLVTIFAFWSMGFWRGRRPSRKQRRPDPFGNGFFFFLYLFCSLFDCCVFWLSPLIYVLYDIYVLYGVRLVKLKFFHLFGCW